MITERIAIVMLEGEVKHDADDRHYTRQFYRTVQSFAEMSWRLSEEGKFTTLQQFLNVACKLFKEGNETVKNGIVNVYLFTLSNSLDKLPEAKKWIEPFMPKELRTEYARLKHASGV